MRYDIYQCSHDISSDYSILKDENPHEPHDGFIHFEDFLEQVHGAKFEHYSDGAVQSAEAFEEMRSHILTMYDGVGEVTHSFFLEFVYVDCIEVKRQPSVRILGLDTIETAPHRITRPGGDKGGDGRDSRKNVRSPLELGLTNPFGNAISCPEDTIPFSRITFEGVTSFATLKGFFSKSPDGDLPDAGTHQYAFSYQNVINYGGMSYINLWQPVGFFSLSVVYCRLGCWVANCRRRLDRIPDPIQ